MKISCPRHPDKEPSFHIYENGGYCFSCGYYEPRNASINADSMPRVDALPPEDLNATMELIRSLPERPTRGLYLKSSENGYFIVWPNNEYYKFRKHKGEPRYLAPRGHKQPLLSLKGMHKDKLIIVEGELNALSVYSATGLDTCSPGAAGNFTSLQEELVKKASEYAEAVIWVDHDRAGIKALWSIYMHLINLGIRIIEHSSEVDANEILMTQGPGGLKRYVDRILEGNNGQNITL